jgi:hypothetical protein
MQPCRCVFCGALAQGEQLPDFVRAFDCEWCGRVDLTAAARWAWYRLPPVEKAAVLSTLRIAARGMHVVLRQRDVEAIGRSRGTASRWW